MKSLIFLATLSQFLLERELCSEKGYLGLELLESHDHNLGGGGKTVANCHGSRIFSRDTVACFPNSMPKAKDMFIVPGQ